MKLIKHEAGRARIVDDPRDPDAFLTMEDLEAAEGEGLAVRVDGSTDPTRLAPHLSRLALVAVELPRFTDGRAYSLARLLRERHGFRGELRAQGHVLRDQLYYLFRCGFDAFVLAGGKDLDDALTAFADFSGSYQPAADHARPVWRRRT